MERKKALVTGASTGIGRAVAIELGKRGFRVGLVARSGDRLNITKQMVEKAGGEGEVWDCDLADLGQVTGLVMKVKEKFGQLDVLANIAGVWHGKEQVYAGKDFDTFEQKVILDTLTVGFTAPTLLIHGLMPIMVKGSAIVNLSGTFAFGAKGWLPYFASKRALEDLTAGLAEELADKGIRVCGVSPADTATDEYIKYYPEDAVGANTPEQVAELVSDLAESGENGKFWVIRQGVRSEGFHV